MERRKNDERKISGISYVDWYVNYLCNGAFSRILGESLEERMGTIEELKTELLRIIDGLDYADVQQYREISLRLADVSFPVVLFQGEMRRRYEQTWQLYVSEAASAYSSARPEYTGINGVPNQTGAAASSVNTAPLQDFSVDLYIEFYYYASIFVCNYLNETNKYKSLIPRSKIDAAMMYMYNAQTVEEAYEIKQQKEYNECRSFGDKGEAEVEYALKWLVGDYIKVDRGQSENNKGSAIVLNNKDFIDEPQEFDHIVIGPQGIFNIETKNYAGKLIIDKNGNWIRVKADGNENGERNPIQQIRRHEAVLKSIVGENIPIINILVMANPKMIIEGVENCSIPLIKSDRLEEYIATYKNDKAYAKSEMAAIRDKLEQYRILR